MKAQNGSFRIKSGSWVFRYRETVREDGTTKRVMRSKIIREVTAEDRRSGMGKHNRKGELQVPADVKEEADRIIEPLRVNPTSIAVTIGDFVTDYLKDRAKDLKPGVHYNYSRLWEKHLEHRIAGDTLRSFDIKAAFKLFQEISRDNPGLSKQTVAHLRWFLSGVIKAAKNRGAYDGENPMEELEMPKGLRGRGETLAYSIGEVNKMLPLFAGKLQAQAIIALAFGSGMRKGELEAIRWDDYEPNSDGARFHVRQNVYRGKIQTPKTESSADDVEVPAEVRAYIDAYREQAGNPKTGLMFCYSPKRPINLQSFARWTLTPVLKKAGITWKTWHGFRRGNATYLAQQQTGNGVRMAQVALRHSDQGVTEDHYIKDTKQQRRARAAFAKLEVEQLREKASGVIGQGLRLVQ